MIVLNRKEGGGGHGDAIRNAEWQSKSIIAVEMKKRKKKM